MLDHLGMGQEAQWIEDAVRAAIAEGQTARDLGGMLKTSEVGDWVANRIAKSPARARG